MLTQVRRDSLGCRFPSSLALIVDAVCGPVSIDNHRDSSGGRVRSLFLVALAVDTLGHSNIRVTQVFCNNLKIFCFRTAWPESWCGSSETAFIVD
jgi:hypothetical protein